jgi:sulfur transfer complex TusBCD TusB component (DsrH family)
MSMLIVGHESVVYRLRGIFSRSISFFRSLGGGMGIGLLGALFNMLTSRDVASLREHGVKPAALLDPHAIAQIPHAVLAQAQHMIARGLTFVFGAMLLAAVALWCAMRLLPAHQKTNTPIRAADALEVA